MNEMGSDEELRATIGERANGVGVPDFLKEAFSHSENSAVVGGGAETCIHLQGLSKPHAPKAGEKIQVPPSSLLQFDHKSGNNGTEREQSQKDDRDLNPAHGIFRARGFPIHPLIPSPCDWGAGSMVVAEGAGKPGFFGLWRRANHHKCEAKDAQ